MFGGGNGGGGGGGMFGSLIEGIFKSVEQSQGLQAQKEAAETAAFFQKGTYSSKQYQDLIIFVILVLFLAAVLFFYKR